MEAHLSRFIEQVKSRTDGEGGEEYSDICKQTVALKRDLMLRAEAGALEENAKKNRYKDILPYDSTRVALSLFTDPNETDYINANFIQGAIHNKLYIATQGPLKVTVVDFWRMIWQYDVKVIIMACREVEMGKKKCEKYWADPGETSVFGAFTITNVGETCPNEEDVVRTLMVQFHNELHTISQYQYTAWPDHGIPYMPDGILEMLEMARQDQGGHGDPVLVHCSAGCGRTGVICALDYIHDLLHTKRIAEDFSIRDIVLELRKQRPSAVQTKEQYEFLFLSVVQMFEKVLQYPVNSDQKPIKPLERLYSNVGSVNPAPSGDADSLHTNSKPVLQPSLSHPPTQKMDVTYAVVNKTRQPPATATCPAATAAHHYDNDEPRPVKSPVAELYSTVKPKSRATCSPAPAATSIYDKAGPDKQRAVAGAAGKDGDYELVTEPLPAFSRESQPALHAPRGSADGRVSNSGDYEYVTNLLKESGSFCTPGNMGFNCRVKKPKGPRNPPSEWSRAEC
ncbi:tyrosine-protein phosphatase non-receptor type 18 isoform X2 [Denticeps clupeoides]|uniref:protein-tyrosine-phosphatase n=1 Tax=Denticeps clupeoides TaxID=299321 RepID=A0AAY4DLB1_9TELE|nr:tyrosine-protein phosphatase non-receptor type 18-like isoform X2 [Denticeps clupeoides]